MTQNFNTRNINDFQNNCLKTWKKFETTVLEGWEMELLHSALLVADEAGELVSPIKKYIIYNKPLDIDNIKEEIGDLLYALVVLADIMGFSLEEIMAYNAKKLSIRYGDSYSDVKAQQRKDKEVDVV
jgi:NTP pyrophosphatase (non-canonical NTP hydrolase)